MSDQLNTIVARLVVETGILSPEKVKSEFSHWERESESSFEEYLVNRQLLKDHEARAIRVLVNSRQDRSEVEPDEPATIKPELYASDTIPDKNSPKIEREGNLSTADDVPETSRDPDRGVTSASNTLTGGSPESSDRFKVKCPHASGGLGEVFIAEDTELNREVALKRIKWKMADRRDMRQRFMLEAELTGGLEHPGVVPVYGLGKSRDGRPYYAMRFIRGESLADAIKLFHENYRVESVGDAALKFRKLLQRMIAVCNTIHYAHTRGVLHRDIKPDNIMLGKFGETLVVDWGLARTFTGQSAKNPTDGIEPLIPAADSGKIKTQFGYAVGTIGFMSPRQASGQHDLLRPKDDVYSLGSTLFCLLTGKRPYDGKIIGLDDSESSLAPASPRSTNPDVPPPLDAICSKTLALDESERYASASELADDLEAYLADEPVSAWDEPIGIRLMRWFRRHKTLVTSLAAAVIVATIGLAIASFMLDQARRREAVARTEIALKNEHISGQQQKLVEANRIAQRNLMQARNSIDKWYTLIAESDELKSTPRTEVFRRSLLERAGDYYQEFLDQSGDDPEVQHEAARAAFRLGRITRELHPGEKALSFYDRSIDMLRSLTVRFPTEVKYWNDLFDAVNGKSIVLSVQLGRIDQALLAADDLNRIAAEIVKLEPENVDGKKASLSAQQNKAGILIKAGKTGEALKSYEKIVPRIQSLSKEHPEDFEIRENLAAILFNRGSIFSVQLKNDMARKDLEAAVRLRKELLAKEDSEQARFQLANTATNLGLLYNRLKQKSNALESYDLVIQYAEQLAKDHPDIADYSHLLVKGITNRAQVIQSSGDLANALDEFRRALKILKRMSEKFPDVRGYVSDAATIQFNIAFALSDSGDSKAALTSFAEAEKKFAKLFEANPDVISNQMRLTVAQIQLAQQHLALDQIEAARQPAENAVENGEQLVKRAPDARNYLRILSSALNVEGRILTETGDRKSAEAVFNRTIEIRKKLAELNPDDPSARLQLADVYYNFAIFHDGGGNSDQVVKNMKQASSIISELQSQNVPLPPSTIASMAIADYYIARYHEDASRRTELLRDAMDSMKSALNKVPNDPHLKKYLDEATRELEELDQ